MAIPDDVRGTMGELKVRFTYHPPKEDQADVYQAIRGQAFHFAEDLEEWVPDCRERSLALTKLEEVVFWANAGLARRG